jgi:hypothetical protein
MTHPLVEQLRFAASRHLSVGRASVGRRIGVSQVPCPIWARQFYRSDGSPVWLISDGRLRHLPQLV